MMREILAQLEEWQASGQHPLALATLIATRGPSPRPSGARMVMTAGGAMAGSISGGCVEADVFEHARRVLATGRPIVQSYGITDEISLAVGLSCGGTIDVLIEPFSEDEAWRALRRHIRDGVPIALCTALAPGELLGGRLAVPGEGPCFGSLAGAPAGPGAAPKPASACAELDAEVAAEARRLLAASECRSISFQWHGEEVQVFVEAFVPQSRLYIVGATHTAIFLARMARIAGFHVSVIDPRAPFATVERFGEVDALRCEWPDEALSQERLDETAFVLTLTHDEKFDIPTLTRALRSDVRYIGALGSRRTHEKRKARLREEGFSAQELARIHTPIGLDIGARSPEEIAVSILAELVAVKHGRDDRTADTSGRSIRRQDRQTAK